MIQANEIRIGNYIADIWTPNGLFKVTELRKDKIFYGNCFKAKYDDIRPIPLTEDILIKAGFLQFDSHCEDAKGVYEYYNYKYDIYDQILFVEEWRRVAKIGYLHQLQNLIFALTGEEIKIEL